MIRDVAIRIKKLLRKVRKGRKGEDRITERFDRQMVSIRSSCPQARVTAGRSSNGARFLKTVCSGAPKALPSCRQYGERSADCPRPKAESRAAAAAGLKPRGPWRHCSTAADRPG